MIRETGSMCRSGEALSYLDAHDHLDANDNNSIYVRVYVIVCTCMFIGM